MVSFEDKKKEVLERIKAENDLVHQRMSWPGTFQGILFAIVAFAWEKATARPIVCVACFVGFLASSSIGYAIYRANVAIDRTTAYFDSIKPDDYCGMDSEGVRSGSGFAWFMPGAFIPWVFAVSWASVLFVALLNWPPNLDRTPVQKDERKPITHPTVNPILTLEYRKDRIH